MRILDCGCGIGRWTKELIKRFPDAEVIALDNKRRLPELNIKFVKGSSEDLPFKDNEFDLVIASRLLPYVNMELTINEIERVVKPCGLIVYELIQAGYYLKKLLKGNLKRGVNFINLWSYANFGIKLFKDSDTIDSRFLINFFSEFYPADTSPLTFYYKFPICSLLFMTKNGKIYKKELHEQLKKIAKDVVNEET